MCCCFGQIKLSAEVENFGRSTASFREDVISVRSRHVGAASVKEKYSTNILHIYQGRHIVCLGKLFQLEKEVFLFGRYSVSPRNAISGVKNAVFVSKMLSQTTSKMQFLLGGLVSGIGCGFC
jgi:hypothetical protein